MIKKFLLGLVLWSFVLSAAAGQDTLLPLAARTTTTSSTTQVRAVETAAHFILHVTAASGTGGLTFSINATDFLGNNYTLLTAASAVTTTGTSVYKIGRGIGQISGGATADLLPDLYYITVTAGDSSSYTYSVTVNRDP